MAKKKLKHKAGANLLREPSGVNPDYLEGEELKTFDRGAGIVEEYQGLKAGEVANDIGRVYREQGPNFKRFCEIMGEYIDLGEKDEALKEMDGLASDAGRTGLFTGRLERASDKLKRIKRKKSA